MLAVIGAMLMLSQLNDGNILTGAIAANPAPNNTEGSFSVSTSYGAAVNPSSAADMTDAATVTTATDAVAFGSKPVAFTLAMSERGRTEIIALLKNFKTVRSNMRKAFAKSNISSSGVLASPTTGGLALSAEVVVPVAEAFGAQYSSTDDSNQQAIVQGIAAIVSDALLPSQQNIYTSKFTECSGISLLSFNSYDAAAPFRDGNYGYAASFLEDVANVQIQNRPIELTGAAAGAGTTSSQATALVGVDGLLKLAAENFDFSLSPTLASPGVTAVSQGSSGIGQSDLTGQINTAVLLSAAKLSDEQIISAISVLSTANNVLNSLETAETNLDGTSILPDDGASGTISALDDITVTVADSTVNSTCTYIMELLGNSKSEKERTFVLTVADIVKSNLNPDQSKAFEESLASQGVTLSGRPSGSGYGTRPQASSGGDNVNGATTGAAVTQVSDFGVGSAQPASGDVKAGTDVMNLIKRVAVNSVKKYSGARYTAPSASDP